MTHQHKFTSTTVRMVKLPSGWYRIMAGGRVCGMVQEGENGWIADIGDSAPYDAPSRMTAVGLCLSAYYDGFDPSGEEQAFAEQEDSDSDTLENPPAVRGDGGTHGQRYGAEPAKRHPKQPAPQAEPEPKEPEHVRRRRKEKEANGQVWRGHVRQQGEPLKHNER